MSAGKREYTPYQDSSLGDNRDRKLQAYNRKFKEIHSKYNVDKLHVKNQMPLFIPLFWKC